MKNFFKSIVLGATFLLPFCVKAAVVSGIITDNGAWRNAIILTTNRASVYSVEVSATANTLIQFYDIDNTNAPTYWGTNNIYYTNASFVSRSTVPTNYVYSFVGYNGFTNWYTNVGVWTYTITNAANTNLLQPLFSAIVAGNTYATYSVDALFVRGIVAVASTGTNINMVVNYRSGQ